MTEQGARRQDPQPATPSFEAAFLAPLGNPMAVSVLGGAGVFVLMANQDQVAARRALRRAVLLSALAALLRALGLLRATDGRRRSRCPRPRSHALPGEPAWAAPRTTVPAALIVLARGRRAARRARLAVGDRAGVAGAAALGAAAARLARVRAGVGAVLAAARHASGCGIRGRRTTARSRARSCRATTGSACGGRRTAGSGPSRS